MKNFHFKNQSLLEELGEKQKSLLLHRNQLVLLAGESPKLKSGSRKMLILYQILDLGSEHPCLQEWAEGW